MADVPALLTWIRAAPEGEEGPGPWNEIAFGPDELVHTAIGTTAEPSCSAAHT
ncbi:hypothetical protein ACFC0C_20440 [Streptomyces sp. NPDC056178]|uniref:hypothetical protein n=1 Tax=unclassified Streptomyces TaxID=2593676 RepID=UPI0035DBEE3C